MPAKLGAVINARGYQIRYGLFKAKELRYLADEVGPSGFAVSRQGCTIDA